MLAEIGSILGIAKSAIDIGKEAKDLMPDGKEKEQIAKQIELTEKELAIAEATAAKDLGYDLCKCTFPPQVMLYKKESRSSECPKCGHSVSKKMIVDVIESKSKWNDFI